MVYPENNLFMMRIILFIRSFKTIAYVADKQSDSVKQSDIYAKYQNYFFLF